MSPVITLLFRLVRWLDVVAIAWALRHGREPADVLLAFADKMPASDPAWRLALVRDAQVRNARRAAR